MASALSAAPAPGIAAETGSRSQSCGLSKRAHLHVEAEIDDIVVQHIVRGALYYTLRELPAATRLVGIPPSNASGKLLPHRRAARLDGRCGVRRRLDLGVRPAQGPARLRENVRPDPAPGR